MSITAHIEHHAGEAVSIVFTALSNPLAWTTTLTVYEGTTVLFSKSGTVSGFEITVAVLAADTASLSGTKRYVFERTNSGAERVLAVGQYNINPH